MLPHCITYHTNNINLFYSSVKYQANDLEFYTGDLELYVPDAHEEYFDAEQIFIHENYNSTYYIQV